MYRMDEMTIHQQAAQLEWPHEEEACGACGEVFDTLEAVFAHECGGLPERAYARPETRRSDNVDAPQRSGPGRGRRSGELATEKQVGFLVKLGVDVEEARSLTKRAASQRIDELLQERERSGQPVNLASEKQLNFLWKLLAERPTFADSLQVQPEDLAKLDKQAASKAIDQLLQVPVETQRPQRSQQREVEVEVELEDAIYQVDGEVRKVYRTQAGHQVTKVWREHGEWEYVGKRGLQGLTPKHQMTLEQAKEFGAIYGRCCNCGRQLTDETSIEAGIGPVCASRFA